MRVTEDERRWLIRRLLAWGRRNRRGFPWREERDPFRILVAEVLLQRSRGTTVARVYEVLFARWPTVGQLARADVDEIMSIIRPLGLTGRAASLRRLAAEVEERGGVPRSVHAMMRLAGVGRYSASATASAAFGRPEPTVDGTSARVYRRYFGLSAPRDSQVDDSLWALAAEVTPGRGVAREWNWAVLDLAATICLPKVPRCSECPLVAKCFVGSQRISVTGPGRITNM